MTFWDYCIIGAGFVVTWWALSVLEKLWIGAWRRMRARLSQWWWMHGSVRGREVMRRVRLNKRAGCQYARSYDGLGAMERNIEMWLRYTSMYLEGAGR